MRFGLLKILLLCFRVFTKITNNPSKFINKDLMTFSVCFSNCSIVEPSEKVNERDVLEELYNKSLKLCCLEVEK